MKKKKDRSASPLVCFLSSDGDHQDMRYQLLSKSEFKRALNRKNVRIIDLREPEDYRRWHFTGAENRSYDYIHEWVSELDRRTPILLYCMHGNESILAARYLASRGYEVASLIGGVGRR